MSADVVPQGGIKRGWNLTEAAFERLLGALDADRDRAAVAYEQLRRRLIGLLEWWGSGDGEGLADATLDRVARKLEEGAVIQTGSLGAYVRGVARMIFYEAARQPRPRPSLQEPIARASDEDIEMVSARLDTCLAMLEPEERDLVLRYYGPGKAAEVRRELAIELQVSPTALRIRAHRLRERLERSLAGCREKP